MLAESISDCLPYARAVIDGEICSLDKRGKPQFKNLMFRRGNPPCFFAFDLLTSDGKDLRTERLNFRLPAKMKDRTIFFLLESEALVLVEEWRDRQGQGPGQLPNPTAESFVNQPAESCPSHGRLQPRITEALSNLVSRDHEFQALSSAAKQNELSAMTGFVEAHPWLAKLIGAGSPKDAAGTAKGFGSEGIRRKAA